jgi:hypothetical protein
MNPIRAICFLSFWSLLVADAAEGLVGTVDFRGDPDLQLSSIEEAGPQANRWSNRPDSRLMLNPQ